MHRSFILLLTVQLLCLSSKAADSLQVFYDIVTQWNTIHNKGKAAELKPLLDGIIYYYGEEYDQEKLLKEKAVYFKKLKEQEITSPIQITSYNSGITRCAFTLKVTEKDNAYETKAYLLFKLVNGKYLISGESDMDADKNAVLKPELGNEISPEGDVEAPPFLAMLIGAVAVIGVSRYFIYKYDFTAEKPNTSYKKPEKKAATTKPLAQPVIAAAATVETNADTVHTAAAEPQHAAYSHQVDDEEHDRNGKIFQHYILRFFPSSEFEMLDWRNDHYSEDIAKAMNTLPGIEFRVKQADREIKFGVVSRWIKEFHNGKLTWAHQYQLKAYKDWEYKYQNHVFTIIGLGGSPGSPEKLFIIPLRRISSPMLTETEARKYVREKTGDFTLKSDGMFLE